MTIHAANTFQAIDKNAEPIVDLRRLGQLLAEKLNAAVEGGMRMNGKVDKLLSILEDHKASQNRAMVFVQQRVICRCLYEYINLLPNWRGKCGMVVGQATGAGVPLDGLPSHRRTMHAFREGNIKVSISCYCQQRLPLLTIWWVLSLLLQLLMTTDVLSEGIDIPECSVVVVFDRINTAQSFAQMRGRARSKDGLGFVVLVPDPKEEYRVRILEEDAKKFQTLDWEEQPVSYLTCSGWQGTVRTCSTHANDLPLQPSW